MEKLSRLVERRVQAVIRDHLVQSYHGTNRQEEAQSMEMTQLGPESKSMTVPDENLVSFLPDPSPRLFRPLSPRC